MTIWNGPRTGWEIHLPSLESDSTLRIAGAAPEIRNHARKGLWGEAQRNAGARVGRGLGVRVNERKSKGSDPILFGLIVAMRPAALQFEAKVSGGGRFGLPVRQTRQKSRVAVWGRCDTRWRVR